jgi:hypothetical protein
MKSIILPFLLLISVKSFAQLAEYIEGDIQNESKMEGVLKSFSEASENDKKDWVFTILEGDEVSDSETKSVLEKLMDDQWISVDLRNKNERSSMFDAAINANKFETTSMIIARGYDVNSRCFKCDAETSIHVLLRQKDFDEFGEEYIQIARELIEKGADLDLRDMKGVTPFHIIIDSKNRYAFDLFMEEDVEFNYQSATLKGDGYLQYFDKKWDDDELRDILMEKTKLKYPPTKKEIRLKQQELREKQKSSKAKSKKKK